MLPRFQTLERKVNLGDKFFIINSLRLKRQVFFEASYTTVSGFLKNIPSVNKRLLILAKY